MSHPCLHWCLYPVLQCLIDSYWLSVQRYIVFFQVNSYTVLLLFRPFCTCSCTRGSNQKHSSHGAPLLPLALLLLELYNNIILMLQKERNCWPLVLDILDDCKCSENFLAPTITTPILLSSTISIQIVDWLVTD